MRAVAAFLCLVSVAASAQRSGALEGKRIAVLEFAVGSGTRAQSRELLSDECRGAVATVARPEGALVITRENMLEVLKATGGKCVEGECEVETARNLGVDLFVTGALTSLDGELFLSLKVYETRKGELLGQRRISGAREKALLEQLRPTTEELVREAFGLGSARPTSAKVQESAMVGNAGGGNARMFKLDVTEVTVSAYAACVAAGTCTEPDTGGKCNWRVTGKEQHPINCVSWMQANAYCQEQGKRLPTGQEWQFAASNGGRTQYPWGDSSPDLIRAKWGSPDGTSPVGTHPAGATQSGLQDLSGNVFEWTAERGEIRGGSWNYAYEEYLRASYRYRVDATDRSGSIGFRCAQ